VKGLNVHCRLFSSDLISRSLGNRLYQQEIVVTTCLPIPGTDERTLLRELTHRINNELASSINAVSAAAVRADNPEAKLALSNVVDLLQQHADLHRILAVPDSDELIDAAQFIRRLGLALSRCALERIGIRFALVADTLPLEAQRCWRMALAVHELVINAARHACFDGRDGAIKVKLSLTGSVVNCTIADNGSLSARLKPGQGLQIVRKLAKSLGGRLEYGFGEQFSCFLLVFAVTERERRAHRAVAQRRTNATHQGKIVPAVARSQPARQPLDTLFGATSQSRAS
jgi:two-component sensor histidine kinase